MKTDSGMKDQEKGCGEDCTVLLVMLVGGPFTVAILMGIATFAVWCADGMAKLLDLGATAQTTTAWTVGLATLAVVMYIGDEVTDRQMRKLLGGGT